MEILIYLAFITSLIVYLSFQYEKVCYCLRINGYEFTQLPIDPDANKPLRDKIAKNEDRDFYFAIAWTDYEDSTVK